MDILRILSDLEELIEQPRTFWGVTFGLNKDEITMQIAKVRAMLPQDLKTAAVTVRESERILENAQLDASSALESAKKEAETILSEARAEAARLVEEARLQQERMVSESEILKLSKAQSEEIRNQADREAQQLRRGADKYAYDVLNQLEGVVVKVATTIDRGKQEMNRPTEALVAAAPRDKVRV